MWNISPSEIVNKHTQSMNKLKENMQRYHFKNITRHKEKHVGNLKN